MTERYGNDGVLHFQAPISVWENIFATEFFEFSHSDFKGEKVVRAMEYSLPVELDAHVEAVFKVAELPPVVNGKPIIITEHNLAVEESISTEGTLINGYVTPQFLSNLYNIQSNVGSANTRQSIFASLDQFGSNMDLTQFQTLMGIAAKPIAGNIGVSGRINHAQCQAGPENCAETNLDLQYISGVAQNIPTYHIYYEYCDYWSMLANLTSTNTKNPPKVISISYGGYGYAQYHSTSFNNYAILAGTMGITIMVASGDDGPANFGVRDDATLCHYEPSFPAFSPYVTAIGATQVSWKVILSCFICDLCCL